MTRLPLHFLAVLVLILLPDLYQPLHASDQPVNIAQAAKSTSTLRREMIRRRVQGWVKIFRYLWKSAASKNLHLEETLPGEAENLSLQMEAFFEKNFRSQEVDHLHNFLTATSTKRLISLFEKARRPGSSDNKAIWMAGLRYKPLSEERSTLLTQISDNWFVWEQNAEFEKTCRLAVSRSISAAILSPKQIHQAKRYNYSEFLSDNERKMVDAILDKHRKDSLHTLAFAWKNESNATLKNFNTFFMNGTGKTWIDASKATYFMGLARAGKFLQKLLEARHKK